MERHSGRLLQATGVAHFLAGLVWYWAELPGLFRLGPPFQHDFPREAAGWFLLIGPLAWILGEAFHQWIQLRGRLPASVGWSLAAFGGLACLFDPWSGFWLLFPQAFVVIRGARRA